MKLFAVLVLTLLAQVYVSSGAFNPEYSDDFDIFTRKTRPSQSDSSPESSSEERSNNPNIEMDFINEWDDNLRYTPRLAGAQQFQSSASRLPQAQSFKTKVNHRLEGSTPLSNKPELKKMLIKLADQKLEKCKTVSGQELDRHCVGRATGHIMQLIAAVENANENQRRQFHQYKY